MSTNRIAYTLMAATLLTLMVRPADAGFFDRLFGGFTRSIAPQIERALPDMTPLIVAPTPSGPGGGDMRVRGENGPRSAYCVRTCDGHYFPVNAQANMSAAQMCQTFCPASETKLYAGGGIDNATATDGTQYRDLPKAFVYRKQLVANCTCNGKDAFGLARLDVKDDPTLARGDIVATKQGLVAVTGRDQSGPLFTKVSDYRGFSSRDRDRLADTQVTRSGREGSSLGIASPPGETTGSGASED